MSEKSNRKNNEERSVENNIDLRGAARRNPPEPPSPKKTEERSRKGYNDNSEIHRGPHGSGGGLDD